MKYLCLYPMVSEITRNSKGINLIVDINNVDTISDAVKTFGTATYDIIDICCTDDMKYTYLIDKLPWNNIKRAVVFHPVTMNDARNHINDLFGDELTDIKMGREIKAIGPYGVTVKINN